MRRDIAMTSPARLIRVVLTLAAAASITATTGPVAAGSWSGPEFERLTADIRAAVTRHDMRAFHEFHRQLDRLIEHSVGA
jgi:hypothetical protein